MSTAKGALRAQRSPRAGAAATTAAIVAAVETAAAATREAAAASVRVAAHEDLCTERYATINATLAELKTIVRWGATGLIGAMGTLIMAIVFKGHIGFG